MVQIDVADGKFVPNKTWADPEVVAEYLESDAELHLMVEDPLAELRKWEGVQHIKRVIIHVEPVLEMLHEIIIEVEQLYDWQIMLALKPATKLSEIEHVLDSVYGVLFLGVEPGFQGQPFVPEVLEKVIALKAKESGHFISLDGAVNSETLPGIVRAGVDAVCPGSAIFGNDNTPEENVLKMQEEIATLLGE